MAVELTLKVVLEKPLQGVAYGIQKGRAPAHEMVQTQIAHAGDLNFELNVEARLTSNGAWGLYGPFTQGSSEDRFFYIGIGTFAGQRDSPWSRRLKIPLMSIVELLSVENESMIFETHIPGIGRDGGPNCGTVKPFAGWTLIPAVRK